VNGKGHKQTYHLSSYFVATGLVHVSVQLLCASATCPVQGVVIQYKLLELWPSKNCLWLCNHTAKLPVILWLWKKSTVTVWLFLYTTDKSGKPCGKPHLHLSYMGSQSPVTAPSTVLIRVSIPCCVVRLTCLCTCKFQE